MAISNDRILPLCDVLLGAAYADDELRDQEKAEVRALLGELAGELPPEVDARIFAFDPKTFELAKAVAPFLGDSDDDRRKLLFLVSAVNEADDEIDFAEDEYLRALARALALPDAALDGLTVDIETEELVSALATVRRPPPPPPGKK
ncbi:MAG TPA: TerB family tellurite resistance protein [Kofleriaceae bacterium]|nr:TerB family tellurite resistance protein [Kofleriaceae bacterium]